MVEKRPKVIIDSRERNGKLIGSVEKLGVDIEFDTIDVGDYVLSDRVCIERKTIQDFESSIINGRLFDQIIRLKDNYQFPILMLEGDYDYFRLNGNVINGAIASIYIEYGIPVICTYDEQGSAEMIASIARHEQKERSREPTLKGGARAYTHEQFQEYIIGNLPGIGPKLAKSLLKHFKSVQNIANADKEELVKINKIGKKKAELIFDTFREQYKDN